MLTLRVQEREIFLEATNEFKTIRAKTFRLQHSLISISKWESIFLKPLIRSMSENDMTNGELRAYVGCMIIGDHMESDIDFLWRFHADKIIKHIESPSTATTINRQAPTRPSREVITSEVIYYWMIAFSIPLECERWHINRLLTLIDLCNVKNSKGKKASKKDILARNKALNEKRRAALGTSG